MTLKNGQRRVHETNRDPAEIRDALMTPGVSGLPSWVVFNSGVASIDEVADISLYPALCAAKLNALNEAGRDWDLWSALELLDAREDAGEAPIRALHETAP